MYPGFARTASRRRPRGDRGAGSRRSPAPRRATPAASRPPRADSAELISGPARSTTYTGSAPCCEIVATRSNGLLRSRNARAQAHRRRHRRPARVRTRARRLPGERISSSARAASRSADPHDSVREHRNDALAGAGDGARGAHARAERADRDEVETYNESDSRTGELFGTLFLELTSDEASANGFRSSWHRIPIVFALPTDSRVAASRPTKTRNASPATTRPPRCTTSSLSTPEQVKSFQPVRSVRGRPSRVPVRDHARRDAARRAGR